MGNGGAILEVNNLRLTDLHLTNKSKLETDIISNRTFPFQCVPLPSLLISQQSPSPSFVPFPLVLIVQHSRPTPLSSSQQTQHCPLHHHLSSFPSIPFNPSSIPPFLFLICLLSVSPPDTPRHPCPHALPFYPIPTPSAAVFHSRHLQQRQRSPHPSWSPLPREIVSRPPA